MLKIKDNVDLKTLERFGFKNCNSDYYIQDDNYNVIIIIEKDNKIIIPRGTDYNIIQVRETWNVLYDLIKEDLVEKVGDKENE